MNSSILINKYTLIRNALTIPLLVLSLSFSSSAITAASETPNGPPTYSRDIEPIFQKNCQQCHRAGHVAPMALTSYAESRPWAKSIRGQVASKSMPPFAAVGAIGRYKNDIRLTDEEIGLIVSWVNAGAPEGNPKDLPPPAIWDDSPWQGEEPDLIVTFPKITVKQDEVDRWMLAMSDYTFKQDTWVRGFNWKFSSFKTMHHAAMHVIPKEATGIDRSIYLEEEEKDIKSFLTLRGELVNKGVYYPMGGWLPGQRAKFVPEGQAYKIEKGSRFFAEFHHSPAEESYTEESQLGVFLANGPIDRATDYMLDEAMSLRIPPGAANYTFSSKKTFENDSLIMGVRPHMHYRGKAFEALLHLPNGSSQNLLEVPKYDFDWQHLYRLNEPLSVPGGTIVEFIWHWDNSENNPHNPDPTQEVRWGIRSDDEMGGAYLDYTVPDILRDDAFIAKDGIRVKALNE